MLKPGSKEKVTTGAYLPFGTPAKKGQVIKGKIPFSGSVMRIPLTGGDIDLVAWGFRNPFGLAFSPDGQLYVTENAYDDQGSRPVWGTGNVLWAVEKGKWYGWPDYSAGEPLTNEDYTAPGEKKLEFLIENHPDPPPKPAAILGVHSSSNGFDFSKNAAFGFEGQAFIAQFGDQAPTVGKVLNPVGFKVVRVNVKTGEIEDFAMNKGSSNGPASILNTGGLERPVAARFSPKGDVLYVVDFGVLLMTKKGLCRRKVQVLYGGSGKEIKMKPFILPLLFIAFLSYVAAGCSSSRKSEPLKGPLKEFNTEILKGQEVFMKNCNKCHPQGESGLGPALNNKNIVPSFVIKFQIRNGLGVMPSFSKDRISPEELDNLIEYLKALRSK